ncbi:MAG: winged helix-turn-helix transcriptional regulator [Candidatus Omnitrophica bacterium]|nr:winged helix-turn-helix transcriptional regulator [Candidatus Omnitrophota bacterium]
MPRYDCQKSADFLKLFSHPTRLLIVSELLKGKRCVSRINRLIKVRQPNISQHLSILRSSGIVESSQKGKEVCYCLKKPKVIEDLLYFFKKNKPE